MKIAPATEEGDWRCNEYGHHGHGPPHCPLNFEGKDVWSEMGSHGDPIYCNTYMTRKDSDMNHMNVANRQKSGGMDSCSSLPIGSSGARDQKFWSKVVDNTWACHEKSIHTTCMIGNHRACRDKIK